MRLFDRWNTLRKESPISSRLSRRALLKGMVFNGALGRMVLPTVPSAAESAPPQAGAGILREYWFQADSFLHNIVPNGRDPMMGVAYNPDQTSYWAIGFRAYTPQWGKPLPGSEAIGPNTGIPGPILRAKVGDKIHIHFRNNDTYYGFPHSIHPHGVLYRPASDGTFSAEEPNRPGAAVGVGQTYTYEFEVMPSSIGTWPYHDHSMPQAITGGPPLMELGTELGLFGMIAITDSKTPPADREIALFFHDYYAADIPTLSQDFDAFSGFSFLNNTPTIHVQMGKRIRWRIASLGKEMHAFHLHGHRWLYNGRYEDTLLFGPASTLTFDYIEDNPGQWLYHCHMSDHMMGGMAGYYISGA